MASYRGHLVVSSTLGAAYGAAALFFWNFDWGPACLAAGLTTLGGLLPDLDSDSGVPVREMFSLAAAIMPLLLLDRIQADSPEQKVVLLGGLYLFIRYGLANVFRHLTVHRGMFHSLPALLISGLATFLIYHNPDMRLRLYLAGGVMLGFFSHLVLDELYSVDFTGLRPRLNRYAGSALKLASPSWVATANTYVVLLALGFLAWIDVGG
jgi:membrane-bound metal-dependent hydrolase YbcI (DUF457 family)